MAAHSLLYPQDRLQEAVLAYLRSCDSGQPLHANTLLEQYADIATELQAFFEDEACVASLLTPLQSCGLTESIRLVSRDGGQPELDHSKRDACIFGRYELLAEIGRGGMGVVYKARQLGIDRVVALKIIRAGRQASSADLERFRNETRTVAGMEHPHIVPIYDVGEHEGQLYYTMPFLEGGSLASRLSSYRDRPHEAARLVATIARGVHHAHQRGVLHRDVKPSNVLLNAAGRPFVADFGLAKRLDTPHDLTQTGTVLGTPGYMSPEQALGRTREITNVSDVYGLGAILYALLTGRPPFRGTSWLETLDDVRQREASSPQVHNTALDCELAAICLKCLEKTPSLRYLSAEAVADDLDRWLAGMPVQARQIGPLVRAWRWCRRNRLLAASSAATVFLLFAGVIGLAVSLVTVRRARQEAEVQRSHAVKTAAALREQLYAAQIPIAFQHWERGEIEKVSEFLAAYVPREDDEERCGFEWHYLTALVQHQPRKQRQYHAGQRIVYHAAFSPEGNRVATAGEDRTVKLWNSGTGEELATLDGLQDDANCVAFFPDGSKLIAASEDGTLREWDLRTFDHRVLPWRCRGAIRYLQLSPVGNRLVVAGCDPRIHILSTTDWSIQQELQGHTVLTAVTTYSPDGQWLVSCGHDGLPSGRVEGWDLKHPARPVFTIDSSARIHTAAFSPDGALFATGNDRGMVSLWEATSGNHLQDLGQHLLAVRCVCFSPDGQWLASSGHDGRVRVWSLKDRVLSAHFAASPDRIWSIGFSPDGRQLIVASDKGASAWKLPQEKRPHGAFRAGAGDLHRVAFAPTSLQLAVLASDGTILVGDPEVSSAWEVMPFKGLVTQDNSSELMFSGQTLSAVSAAGEIVRCHLPDKHQEILPLAVKRVENADEAARPITPVSWALTPDGRRLAACYADGWLQTWNLPGPAQQFGDQLSLPLATCVLASPDNRTLAVRIRGGAYRFFDLMECRWLSEELGADSNISSWAFAPDGQSLALGQSDGTLQIAAVPDGTIIAHFSGHLSSVQAVAFSPDRKTLASSSTDKTVRLWHARLGQQFYMIASLRSIARSLAFSADGTTLVAGGDLDPSGHNVWMWRTDDYRLDAERAEL